MISIKDFMEIVDYRITEGSDFTWTCFGDHAYSLSAWNGDHDGWSFNITFDTENQTVYLVESCDYKRQRAYRLINPDWRDRYLDYGKTQCGDHLNQAWDDINYVDLETDEDWTAKARAIVLDKDYNTKVQVPLDLSDEELFNLMKRAHELDITLNQLVEQILTETINANN